MDNSSTFLSLLAVISVIAIVSIAITDLDDGKVRQPFPASEAIQEVAPVSESEPEAAPEEQVPESNDTSFYDLAREGADLTADLQVPELDFNADENFERAITEPEESEEIRFNDDREVEIAEENPVKTAPGYKFSIERLRAVGLPDSVIQRRPFDNMLFEDLEIDTLESFDVSVNAIYRTEHGERIRTFDVYAFQGIDEAISSEIYDLIKYKYAGSLGVTVNETNAFGMASFFVNHLPPKNAAFLVVKYPDSVYALSYPREDGFYELIKKLL